MTGGGRFYDEKSAELFQEISDAARTAPQTHSAAASGGISARSAGKNEQKA
jgi:hypothetical protein